MEKTAEQIPAQLPFRSTRVRLRTYSVRRRSNAGHAARLSIHPISMRLPLYSATNLTMSMPEEDEYSRQNMDCAFAPEKSEKKVFSNDFLSSGKISAAVYQSLFCEKVFKEMKERAETFINEQRIRENGNMDALQEWPDTDMAGNIKNRRNVMGKIGCATLSAESESCPVLFPERSRQV